MAGSQPNPAMNTTAHFLPITVGGIILLGGFVMCAVVRDRMWRRLPAGGQEVWGGAPSER